MYRSLTDTPTKDGSPGMTVSQAALRGVGLNVYPIEPAKTRRKNLRYMRYEIQQLKRRRRRIQKDMRLSAEARKTMSKTYNDWIREKMLQMREYAKASRIHKNLR